VKDPGFRSKLVVTFDLNILSFELKNLTKDNKISSVEHHKKGKKYSNSLTLPEVTIFIGYAVVLFFFLKTSAVVQAGQT
jgi:hypothetical protein